MHEAREKLQSMSRQLRKQKNQWRKMISKLKEMQTRKEISVARHVAGSGGFTSGVSGISRYPPFGSVEASSSTPSCDWFVRWCGFCCSRLVDSAVAALLLK